jgi:cytochrome c-type biogenesis protein CcmH
VIRRAAIALSLLLALLAPGSALAAQAPHKVTLESLETQVMCVECGTSLQVSQSPVANQERAFITRLINQGKDVKQIKSALVAQYGDAVLAEPPGGGFNSTLWIVPVVIVLLGAAGIVYAVRRWRRAGPAPEQPLAPALSDADTRRLDAELRR